MDTTLSLPAAILGRLVTRWSTSAAAVTVAALLVWYLGPLLPALTQPLPRIVLILVLVLAWACVNSALAWRRRRREDALARSIAAPDGGSASTAERAASTAAEAADEVARLRERVGAALARLRRSGTRGALYEQPWFVLIGPPGAGKTTALRNAGLQFPLTGADGSDVRVAGVGGTRLCDWWFADQAVLIDTAGRYTTQDSDASVDRAGWLGFLDLLRRARPRQPLNGALVVVSLVEIAGAEPAERAAHARAVRRRVVELSERLRLRVPVYMMFSKADQLDGFTDFFDDLDAEARSQVWGATFPLARGVEGFAAEFRLLLERLERRSFERLQAERAPERRARIAGFPLQVASLLPPLDEFLQMAFGGTKLDPAPLLRGVYMSSATQEGTPIDRMTGMLARSFGIDQQRAPSLRPTAGRAHFIKRLLGDVVLGEALLVSADPARRRRRLAWRVGGFATVGLATLAVAALLWRVESVNRLAVEQATEALAAYRAQLQAAPLDPVRDDDPARVVPLLDTAEALPRGAANAFLALGQARKLEGAERLAYRHALERILLPRLILRLETQMRNGFGDPGHLYDATRIYLMIGGAGPLDAGLVRQWEALDWARRYPGALNAALRDRLAHHLDMLLAEPLAQSALDGGLVGAARATFSRVSLAQRVYGRVQADAAGAGLPVWTPEAALGGAGAPMFTRVSGAPLTEGVPGLYTADGLRVLLADLPMAAHAAAGESWVLGPDTAAPEIRDPLLLEREVITLYCADAEAHWDRLLGDLALAPFGSRAATLQSLYVLASPQSPLRDLLTAIVRAVSPVPPPDKAVGNAPSTAPGKPLAESASAAGQAADPAAAAARAELDGHYAALRRFIGDGTAPPLQSVLRVVDTLQGEIARSGPNSADTPAAFQAGGDPVELLLAEAQRQPAPVSRWLRQIAVAGRATLAGNASAAASGAFEAADGPAALCRAVVAGHYPFVPAARVDAPIDGFARLFAPNGALDSFFKTQLAPYVDTSHPSWRPATLAGIAAPADAATIALFRRAAQIRDAFFANGGNVPEIRFTVSPPPDDPSGARLLLGGATIDPASGPKPLLWPGADGMTTASVVAGSTTLAQADGPWALFHLLDAARLSGGAMAGGDGDSVAAFGPGGQARFGFATSLTPDPLRARLLEGFHCPAMH